MISWKHVAVIGGWLTLSSSILAQEWRSASPEGWKASPSIGAQELPTVSTFRGVQQGAIPDSSTPVRATIFDERMPRTDTLPPPENPQPAPKAVLGPLKAPPKACLAPPAAPNRIANSVSNPAAYLEGTPRAPAGFDPAAVVRPRDRVWFTPEYLLWRTSGMKIPPIATSSPLGTDRSISGVLGYPSTTLLYGDQKILGDWRSGIRLNAGFWLNDEQTTGIDVGFLYLGTKQNTFSASSTGETLLSRPFYDASTGQQSAQLIAYATRNQDGTLAPSQVGTIGFRSKTYFWGSDVSLRQNLWDGPAFRLDGTIGFRYLQLRDKIDVGSTIEANDPNNGQGVPFGSTFASLDSFSTRSDFYGGQLGLRGEFNYDRWSLGFYGKIALGSTINQVSIDGYSISNAPGGASQITQGGLLAQATNAGHYSSSAFSVVPELGLNVGYQLTENIRLFAGYSGLYWTHVARAGQQIDFVVNSTQLAGGTLVGPARPAAIVKESGFWASGASIGLELRW